MSYFDNIVFDENTLLEGEQAEAYKAKKAAEKEAREKESEKYNNYGRDKRKFSQIYKDDPDKAEKVVNADNAYSKEKDNRAYRASTRGYNYNIADKNFNNITGKDKKGAAIDAIMRYDRRHPDRKLAEAFEAYNPEFIEL